MFIITALIIRLRFLQAKKLTRLFHKTPADTKNTELHRLNGCFLAVLLVVLFVLVLFYITCKVMLCMVNKDG